MRKWSAMNFILRTTKIFMESRAIIIALFFVVSCLPVQKKTQCGDNEAFDGSERRCVPVIGAASTGTVFITSRAPSDSYVVNPTSLSVQHSLSVSDVYNYGYSIKWYVHYLDAAIGSKSTKVATNVSKYTFVPSVISGLYGMGRYVLEAIVYDLDGENQLDSTTWSIQIQGYTTPTLNSPVPGGVAYSYPRNSTSETLQMTAYNPANVNTYFQWYLDGVAQVGTPAAPAATVTANIDPSALSLGMHTVEFELRDSNTASYSVHDNYVWTINITDPDLPTLVTLLDDNAYDLVSSGTIYATDATGIAATTYINDTGAAFTDVCVTVDDFDKDGDAATDVRLRLSINGLTQFTQNFTDDDLCLSEVPYTLPLQYLTVPQSTINKSFTISLINAIDNTIIESYPLNLIVRPRNIAPTISIRHLSSNPAAGCDTTNSYNTTGCTMTQSLDSDGDANYADAEDADNSRTFDIYVSDGDETAAFDLYFELSYNGGAYQPLDGTQTNTGTSVVCELAAQAIASSYSCQLHLDAYGTNGSLPPGSYTLRASVQDTTDPYGGGLQTSNYVTWAITVSEYQSTGTEKIEIVSITAEDRDSDCSGVAGVQLAEGEYMNIDITYEDHERDAIKSVQIFLENQYSGGYSSVATLATPTPTGAANALQKTISHCITIPEWAVVGVERRDVGIQVTITDLPDSAASTTSDTFTGTATDVINSNHLYHIPQFADAATVDLSTEGHVVYSGYEYHIDPPAVTDTSSYGGKNIIWQWEISDDMATWTAIPQANSTDSSDIDLYWTPDPSITATTVHFRLCVGDDGYGNPADCSKTVKEYQNLNIEPGGRTLDGDDTNLADTGTVASWYDETEKYLYVAYGSGTDIVVEKLDFNDPTVATTSRTKHWIKFSTEAPDSSNGGPYTPTELRLVGVDSTYLLVIASVANNLSYNEMRLYRIHLDLSGIEAFGFNYYGLFDDSLTVPQVLFPSTTTDPTSTQLNDSDLTFTFTVAPATPADDSLTFTDNQGTTHQLTYGVGNYCNPACATLDGRAAGIRDEIMGQSTFFGQEVVAEQTAGNNFVNLYSNPTNSFLVDSSVSVVKMGTPIIDDNDLYIPIIDGFRGSRPVIYQVTNFDTTDLTSVVPSVSDNTGLQGSNTDIDNAVNSAANGMHIVVKGPDGNLDYYTATFGASPTLQIADLISTSVSNNYNDLNDISVTADGNNNVMIAGITYSSGTGGKNLLSGTIEDYSDATSTPLFNISTFSDFVDQIDQVKITAVPGATGEAIIALTTAAGTAGYTARVMKVKSTIVGDAVTAVTFPAEATWVPPALFPGENVQRSSAGGAMAITPIFDIELGYGLDSDLNGTYKTHASFFVNYVEDNGGSGEGTAAETIRSIIVNTEAGDNPTTDDSTTYVYPPFVKDQ